MFNIIEPPYIHPLILSQTSSQVFTCLQYKSFKNIVGKGEIAHNEQFLFSRSVFYPHKVLSAIFIKFKIVVCKLFQF